MKKALFPLFLQPDWSNFCYLKFDYYSLKYLRSNMLLCYETQFFVINYRVSKKSVICIAWCKIFCATLLYGVFSIFFLVLKRKSANLFFLSKSKVQKSKIVYINYFYQDLKMFKDWIKESQKICKIVIRKFTFLFWFLRKSYLNSLVPFFIVYSNVFNKRCSIETLRAIEKQFFP